MNETMKVLKIKNKYLIGLASWLNEQILPGKLSRERSRFIEILSEQLQRVEKDRIELVKKYAKKDDKEQPIVEDSKYVIEDEVSFNKEYDELINEEFMIDITPSTELRYAIIKKMVIDTDYKFGPKLEDSDAEKMAKIRQMQDYEKWCECFENI